MDLKHFSYHHGLLVMKPKIQCQTGCKVKHPHNSIMSGSVAVITQKVASFLVCIRADVSSAARN